MTFLFIEMHMYYIDSLHRVKYFMPSFLELMKNQMTGTSQCALQPSSESARIQINNYPLFFFFWGGGGGGMVSFCVLH